MQKRTHAGQFRNPDETLYGVSRAPLERDTVLAYVGTLTESEWRAAVDYWLVRGWTYTEIADVILCDRQHAYEATIV